MSTRMKTVLTGTLAIFALLTLSASPSLAESRTQTATSSTTTKEANQTQQQISQKTVPVPANETPQQPTQTGCSCCKNMMNTQQMNKKHEMIGTPNN